MSFRTLPKLDLITPLNKLTDALSASAEYLNNREKELLLELEQIAINQINLETRLDELSEEDIAKQQISAQSPNLDELKNIRQKSDNIKAARDALQRQNEAISFGSEKQYITVELEQLKIRQKIIEDVEIPKIEKLLKLQEAKLDEGLGLADSLKDLRDSIDSLFDKIESAIKSISGTPPLGPLVANILQIVVDTINEVLFVPLVVAITAFESSLKLARKLFVKS